MNQAIFALSAALGEGDDGSAVGAYRAQVQRTIIAHMRLIDQYGEAFEREYLADAASLLGRSPATVEEADAWLEDHVRAAGPESDEVLLHLLHRRICRQAWLLAVPGAAVLIGLGPWLGVRTGTSWNMYANLVTARGETNAWFAPGTLRLLDEPDDLVRIVASTDPALDPYIDSGERTPFVNLRLYTSSHPVFSITYERDGVTTTVDHSRVDDELGSAPEWWWRKVLTYRSVDIDGPARCQETMWALR